MILFCHLERSRKVFRFLDFARNDIKESANMTKQKAVEMSMEWTTTLEMT